MKTLLLVVAEAFLIEGRGVLLAPDLSVPSKGWTRCFHQVTVVMPNGCECEYTALFELAHYNFRAPAVSMDKRWRVALLLPDRKQEDVPIGSKVFVSQDIKDILLPLELVRQ